ncbi:MAG: hypothetical protein AAF449_24700 [Myxococcota bacterium]
MRSHEGFIVRDTDIEVTWIDNNDRIDAALLADAMVFGNMSPEHPDYLLPLRNDAFYVMHDHAPIKGFRKRYRAIQEQGRATFYEVFRRRPDDHEAVDGEPFHFRSIEAANQVIIWGTDLLPDEIEDNVTLLQHAPREKRRAVVFVGTVWRRNYPDMADLARAAADRDLVFDQYGRHFAEAPWPDDRRVCLHPYPVPLLENIRLVREALIAPAVQGRSQMQNDDDVGNYIPCRIFKNISYGAEGATNNRTVYDLFDGDIPFSTDLGELLDLALARADGADRKDRLHAQMRRVAAHHTYINRIHTLLAFARQRYEHCGRPAPASSSVDPAWLGARRIHRALRGWQY